MSRPVNALDARAVDTAVRIAINDLELSRRPWARLAPSDVTVQANPRTFVVLGQPLTLGGADVVIDPLVPPDKLRVVDRRTARTIVLELHL